MAALEESATIDAHKASLVAKWEGSERTRVASKPVFLTYTCV